MTNQTKGKIFLWLYRTFCFYVPGGLSLWTFLIDKLIDKELTWVDKLSVSGIFVVVIMAVIGIFFYGKHLKKKIDKINDEILVCVDNEKKTELITKRNKTKGIQEVFHNVLFIAPFVLCLVLMTLAEKGVVSARGTLSFVVISMAGGLGFNCVQQYFNSKPPSIPKEGE